jgi:hypothetical protein
MSRRRLDEAEKQELKRLYRDGMKYVEISKLMVEKFPDTWGKMSNPKNMVSHYIRKFRNEWFPSEEPTYDISQQNEKTLDEMTREERFGYISSKIQQTPRFKLTFKSFNADEKNLFIEEYLNVVKSIDTLTEVEEQSLFAAILELVLALQSLSRKESEEKLYEATREGDYQQGDSKYTPSLNNAEKYAKEYAQHMKLYQDGLEQLNMARNQRVKEIKSDRRSLVDLAQELSSKSARALAAEQIIELSKQKDEELKKMLDNGWLLGTFK